MRHTRTHGPGVSLLTSLSVLSALVLLAAPATAQVPLQFDTLDGKQVPTNTGRQYQGWPSFGQCLFVDLDGDNALDLVVSSFPGDRLAINDGLGRFAPGQPLLAHFLDVTAVAAGDVDGDGDADLVFAADDLNSFSPGPQQDQLFLNDGTGRFTNATTRLPQVWDYSSAVTLGDVDGDGDLDIYFGVLSTRGKLYLNDGTGRFTDASAQLPATVDNPADARFADVDGDGDLDLVVVNGSYQAGQNRLYRNDGSGNFSAAPNALPTRADASLALAIADIDGDSDLDLLVANMNEQNRLYRNDGNGVFTDATASLPVDTAYTVDVDVQDMDGDGDLDIVFVNSVASNLYLNDGNGTFTDGTATRMPAHSASGVALADVDGDRDIDAFFLSSGPRLFLNDGSGKMQPADLGPRVHSQSPALAFGDVDGDGDEDYVSASGGVHLNNGDGSFRDRGGFPKTLLPLAIELHDLDGDGDLDGVVTRRTTIFPEPFLLLLGDGTGQFTDVSGTHVTGGRQGSNTVAAIGDVDADGDPDLVVAQGKGGVVELYRNDGTARFTDVTSATMPAPAGVSRGVALGDIDGDGDPDLVVTFVGATTPMQIYLNDGKGVFQQVASNLLTNAKGVTLGDVDADGDLDMVVVRCGVPASLLLNDGKGVFQDMTAARMPARNLIRASHCFIQLFAPVFVDIDNDGDLDLLVRGEQVLYVNDGGGHFTDESSRAPGIGASDLDVADVDGDGDLDLLAGGYQDRLFLNLRRQIHAPRLAVIGRAFELQFHARYSTATSELALPFLAAAPAKIPVPGLGTVGIDPGTMFALPSVSIPQPAGSATIQLAVPALPALVGQTFYVQALMVPNQGAPRLSNVLAETVLR